jgi:hypothetical protein
VGKATGWPAKTNAGNNIKRAGEESLFKAEIFII